MKYQVENKDIFVDVIDTENLSKQSIHYSELLKLQPTIKNFDQIDVFSSFLQDVLFGDKVVIYNPDSTDKCYQMYQVRSTKEISSLDILKISREVHSLWSILNYIDFYQYTIDKNIIRYKDSFVIFLKNRTVFYCKGNIFTDNTARLDTENLKTITFLRFQGYTLIDYEPSRISHRASVMFFANEDGFHTLFEDGYFVRLDGSKPYDKASLLNQLVFN